MKRINLILVLFFISCDLVAQVPSIIHKKELQKIFKPDSSLLVINFWSTWCKPCMQEMPLFKKADSTYGNKVKFIFVSFDMREDSARVSAVSKKLGIPGSVMLIDETDMNALIQEIDSGWSGALPATWFIGPLFRKPWFQNFEHSRDLFKEIDLLIASHESE